MGGACAGLLLWAGLVWIAHAQDHYLNQFAIRLKVGTVKTAEAVARQHGFRLKRELPHSRVFLLEQPEDTLGDVTHRSRRAAETALQRLKEDARIALAQQEVALNRVKRRIVYDKQLEMPLRDIDESLYKRVEVSNIEQRDNLFERSENYNDPKYKDMWYLENRGQSGGEAGLDMNMRKVWESGFTGRGVVVTVLDDGVDHTHPDLKRNFDPRASTDLNDKKDHSGRGKQGDPMPDTSNLDNSHGTRCAGEIAAQANNNNCGVGVAYEAGIGGVRILDGVVTDSLECEALLFNNQYIHIYSASWGPSDDGATMEGPRELGLAAIQQGAREGRGGKGSIFVWATGNGGMNDDDCSADGYVSQPETLSVGSVNDEGRAPYFMENCTSTLAVVPSGGEEFLGQQRGQPHIKVVTTDFKGGCIENFQGTSSAAPLAAGCMATVLQANPALTWRDVQHITVRGSRIPSADTSWTINGAGRHVSHRFGFGLMDCARMVELAQDWRTMPEQRVCTVEGRSDLQVPAGGHVTDDLDTDACASDTEHSIDRLEHVQIKVNVTSERRGNTRIILTSPAGTQSEMISTRKKDDFKGQWEFTFMTVHCWDESPRGTWHLRVEDVTPGNDGKPKPTEPSVDLDSVFDDDNAAVGGENKTKVKDEDKIMVGATVHSWSLVMYGTHGTRHGRDGNLANRQQKSYQPSTEAVQRIKRDETQLSKRIQVKKALKFDQKKSEAAQESSASDTSTDQETTEKIYQRLYKLLHSFGAKAVRKRVLLTDGNTKRGFNLNEKRESEVNELWDSNMEKKKSYDSETKQLLDRYVEKVEEQKRVAKQRQIDEEARVAELKRLSEKQRVKEEKRIAEQKRISEQKLTESQREEDQNNLIADQRRITDTDKEEVTHRNLQEDNNILEESLIKKIIQELEVELEAENAENHRIDELKRIEQQNKIAEQKRTAKQTRVLQLQRMAKQERIAQQKRIAEQTRIAKQKRIAQKKRIADQKRITHLEQQRLQQENRMIEDALIKELIEEIEVGTRKDQHDQDEVWENRLRLGD